MKPNISTIVPVDIFSFSTLRNWKNQMEKTLCVVLLSAIFSLNYLHAQVLIDPAGAGGFQNSATFAGNGWTVVNGSVTNQWYVGTVPTGFAGRSAYISDDSGTSHEYTNNPASAVSVVHFYRDVTFPGGVAEFTLSFNWKADGETSSFDAIMVSLAPTSYTPTASNVSLGTGVLPAPANMLGGIASPQLWNSPGVTTATYTLKSADLGNCAGPVTRRLIFTWKNDSSLGDNPPGGIDNISLVGVPMTITKPADRCTDGTNIVFNATPVPGPGESGTFTINQNTPGFVSNGNGTANWTVSNSLPAVYVITYNFMDEVNCVFRVRDTVELFQAPMAQLKHQIFDCVLPGQEISLKQMWDENFTNTPGGVWSVSPGGIFTLGDSTIIVPANGGCYDVTYAMPPNPHGCTGSYTSTRQLLIVPRPQPAFTMNGGSSNVLMCAGSDVNFNMVRTSTGANAVFTRDGAPTAFGNQSLTAPAVGGSISYTFCLEETNNTPAACGPNPPGGYSNCTETVCKTITIYNDGICGTGNAAFASECPPGSLGLQVCSVQSSPFISVGCSFININIPFKVVNAQLTGPSVILCTQDEFTINSRGYGGLADLPGFNVVLGTLPGASAICAVATWCLDLGFLGSWCPFGWLNPGGWCTRTLAQWISDGLASLLGSDGTGGQVVADTDGDGSFDYIVREYNTFPEMATVSSQVPNNVGREGGVITVRHVVGWPFWAEGVCGNVTTNELNLLDLLAPFIDLIPVAGPIINGVIAGAGCDIPLVFSDHADLIIPVLNTSPPNFLNCPPNGYVFTEDFGCQTAANWSVPIAEEACYGTVLDYQGRTAGTDDSFFPGIPEAVVAINTAGVYQTAGPVPGSILTSSPGMYTVTYTAYNCNAIPTECTFTVTVTAGDPILECPNDMTVSTDVDLCQKVVTGLSPVSGIGCATIINYNVDYPVVPGFVDFSTNTLYSPADRGTHHDVSGTTFPLGTTTITYTMLVDLNADGDASDLGESTTCTFDITVVDNQDPVALCVDQEVKLDVNGMATVYATQAGGNPFFDGGSTDNCDLDLTIEIAKPAGLYAASLDYDCTEVGNNYVNLRVTDDAGNVSTCLARLLVIDYLDGVNITLDPPVLCLEANNPLQLDFSNYLTITLPNGQSITHAEAPLFLGGSQGYFGITAFSNPGSGTPGTITADGVYTPGTGTGYITVSYILLPGNLAPPPGNNTYNGCYVIEHAQFELRQPLNMVSPECQCVQEHVRIVDLGILSGGLEPYTIQFNAGVLDVGGVLYTDGEYTYDALNGHDIDDFSEDLGELRIVYNPFSNWSFTIVDARGCELFRSGSCDNADLTVGPTIPTLQDTTLDTKFYFCESNYAWEHPLPSDNCAVTVYSYQINNPDGTVHGPIDLIALLNYAPGAPIDSLFLANYDFELGTSVVLYYAEDAVGNFITNQFLVTVIDDDAPYFINCPYPPVVQDAEFGQCDAYVTFSLPIAFDNCALPPTNTQIDNTGLSTGSRFPVGTTIMYWEAIDNFDNRDTCQVKVIVNDYGNYPTLACPANVVQVNDPWLCSAMVNDIAPVYDNICFDNTRITYSVYADAGLTDRTFCGVWDASGEVFDKGQNWIQYNLASQPLLLITEISQSGGVDQLEITNLGPATVDISCLLVERISSNPAANEILGPVTLLPALDPSPLPVGAVRVFDFTFDGAANLPACYTIHYMGVVFDQVAVNSYPGCAGFTGTLSSGNVYRHCEDDSDDAEDWEIETLCSPLTMGVLNPELDVMPDNGTITSLQSIAPNKASCVFIVEVIDEENPFCGQLQDNPTIYNGAPVTGISDTTCNQSTITVPGGGDCIIGDIVLNISGTANPSNSTITLISPQGIRVAIGEIPADTLEELFAQKAGGEWILDIVPNMGQIVTVTAWTLEITCIEVFNQPDVVIDNDPGLCGASFSWIHPYFLDNCFIGTISVAYTSADAACVPNGGQLTGVSPIGWFGGYAVTEFFCVGTTTVTYTLVDEAGNTHSCAFDVTVLDAEDPVVTCPADIYVNLDPGLCRSIVCYVPAFTDDNCEVVDTIYTPPFCTEFEIGIHDVSITVVDEAGNDATCNFQVHIIEFIPPDKSLKCNDMVQVSIGPECQEELFADDILEGNNYRCYEFYEVTIYSGLSPNVPVLITSPILTGNEAGKQLLVLITDPETGNSCWGKISVEDKQPPLIVCPINITIGCSQEATPAITGVPTVDDCSATTQVPNDLYTDFGQCADPRASIQREWKVTDASGNVAVCAQTITIAGFDLADVVFPADMTISCVDVPFPAAVTPEITGKPAINGTPIDQGGVCDASHTYADEVYDICPKSFEILRTWKVRNTCLPLGPNNPAQHTQLISVLDQTPPTVICPNEHAIKFGGTKKVGNKDCVTNVMLPWIQVTDNCSTNNDVELSVYTILPDGSVYTVSTTNSAGFFVFELPVGAIYTFTYSAKDGCGNVGECAITVEIQDQTQPVVICETFHVVSLSDSLTLVHAISFDDGSYDDCSEVTFAARRGTMNAAGSFVQHPCNMPGDFLYNPSVRFYCCDALNDTPLFVDLRIRDAFGNDNHCMVEVSVVDKVRPVIWCPEDITVQCGMPYEPTGNDTFNLCKQPNLEIKSAYAAKYPVTLDIFGLPSEARITDLDLTLDISHGRVNDLIITLYSPLGRKAKVLNGGACASQQVPNGIDVKTTFNDQAYDINWFNQTGFRSSAPFTCTQAKPSIGAYNQGQMKPQGDELKIFNGEPLNSFTDKKLCFSANQNEINAGTNRISNIQVQQFLQSAGLVTDDRILLEYANATGQAIGGLTVGSVYLFQVINANTIELLPLTGDNINSVPAGSIHMFCASGTWLLVIEDTLPLGGGTINEVCMAIGYALPTGLKPHVVDNTEECGITVIHQDLGQPDKCADGTFINRRWTAGDSFGNNTSCNQRIYFEDETPLTVQFPCDVTVNCPATPDATGEVNHNTDCEFTGLEYSDQTLVTTDGCYKIMRTWTIKDWCIYRPDGNVDYPVTSINEQTEELTFTTAMNAFFTDRNIGIGDRFTLRYVTSGSVEIPGLIEGDVYSVVRVSGITLRFEFNSTKQQSVNITGQGTGPHIFRYANSDLGLPVACDVLLEWYPFVPWYTACCFPVSERRSWEDDGDGYFTFVQEIKVVDNTAPQWVNCEDLEFCSYEANCQPTFVEILSPAMDNCADSTELSYTWSIDVHNDGTTDVEGVGANASGAYVNGTHKITFKVTDRCGNWNTCTRLFTIRDCKKPTPICINGLSVDLMPTVGMATVWAKSLEAGDSYDNCTEYGNLTILVQRLSELTPGQTEPSSWATDSVTVTCDDLPPTAQSPLVEVAVWVGDEAGNWDYCITTILVQDNMGACGNPQNAQLMAYFVDPQQEPVDQITVELTGSVQTTQMVGPSGIAQFNDLPYGQPAAVIPQKDIYPLNGVSTYDLLLIQKHLLGVKALNNTHKLIAADVNKSCNISVSDIIELRKMILTPGLSFKDNTSWRFVEANYVFPNPQKPCIFPETKSFPKLGVMNQAHFVAIKIGDVSGDASPNSLYSGDTRSIVGTLSFTADDAILRAGQQHKVVLKANQFTNIQGYQYTLDPEGKALRILSIEPLWEELSDANFGFNHNIDGTITSSWHSSEGVTLPEGMPLYAITVEAITDIALSEALKINSRITRAEAYDADEELLDVRLRFEGAKLTAGFELYQNEPNPFGTFTKIGFELPVASEAIFTVHDITGKVVYYHKADYPRGYSELMIQRADLPGTGMLYYTLHSGEYIATLRMTLMD